MPLRARVIETESPDLRYYSVIYNLIDEVKAAMSGMLAREIVSRSSVLAGVREASRNRQFGTVAVAWSPKGWSSAATQSVLRQRGYLYEGELELCAVPR